MWYALRQCRRLLHIYWIVLSYGLDEFLRRVPYLKLFGVIRYTNLYRFRHRHLSRGVRLRLALQALGPIFVKFGQTLSTRRDLLPEDIANQLAQLQDKVPAFSSVFAKKMIEQALGKNVSELFKIFLDKPLAAASIAQVHEATLWSGEEVVVKVLRPNIHQLIDRDVDLLYFLARAFEKHIKGAERLRLVEVVREFDQIIHDELDLQREASNAAELKRNFTGSDLLYVPTVYWDYVRQNVLVMERIDGIPVSDVAALTARGINLQALAERGVEIFFTQVFRDSFFHADMHPGNIFVDPNFLEAPRYLGVDFGIMGTLSKEDQRYLAENLWAFFHRDYHRVAVLHIASGWVPSDTRVDQFETAIRAVCDPIFQKPLKDISFGQLLLKFFQTARRFNMVVQPQLVLLQKTLFNVEGLGRQLYPDLDLWVTAKPFLEKWMKQQMGFSNMFERIRNNLPFWLEKLPDMPDVLYRYLSSSNHAGAASAQDVLSLKKEIVHLQRKQRVLSWALSAMVVLIISVFLAWLYTCY